MINQTLHGQRKHPGNERDRPEDPHEIIGFQFGRFADIWEPDNACRQHQQNRHIAESLLPGVAPQMTRETIGSTRKEGWNGREGPENPSIIVPRCAAGRIPGAQHLSKGIIERDIETAVPDPNAEIVLYCGGGFRSALAAESLQKMGYTQVYSLASGWREWLAAGLPTEKPGA